MAEIKKKIAIQQRVLPSYRIPFFDALAAECADGLSVFAGDPRRTEALDSGLEPRIAKFYQGKNINLFDGAAYLCWQAGILNWLQDWKPDVLIMEANPRYLSSGAALNWMKNRGCKVIGWGLGSPHLSGGFSKLRMNLRKRFVKRFDALITYSQQGADEYTALGFPPDFIFCAPNAVAPKPGKPLLKRPLSFRNGKPSVVFVGRMQARKRVETLLHACALLPAELQPSLTIIGDGPERRRLEILAMEVYPETHFTGAQHGGDLAKIYQEADLFVLPGTGGLAVQQAMSFGLPVIVGESDGTQSDLVRDENGWRLTEPNAKSLSQIMLLALSDIPMLRSMGAASYRIVSQEVNLENMVNAFALAIRKVTGGMMHILIVADGHSPITRNWIKMADGLGWRISLVSTFPCEAIPGAELGAVLPAGFSALGGGQVNIAGSKDGWERNAINRFRPLFLSMRAFLAPLLLGRYQKQFAEILEELKPDVVHALRIPFEGMLAEFTPLSIPLIVSIWGNDLTFHARTSPQMAAHTRRTLKRADGLLADASRDIELASLWGLKEDIPSLVVPGNGGLDLREMKKILEDKTLPFSIPKDAPIFVNPRGFRPGSVHQDVFFKSIPLVIEKIPDAFFVCTALQNQPLAERWVRELNLGGHVLLLPYLPQEQLWRLYSRAQVYVSLSSHDGTPNTFLEALACGCFPVVGDIASLREWLTDGMNGLLVDPHDPHQAAHAMVTAATDKGLRLQASKKNFEMIRSRAEISGVREKYRLFIQLLIKNRA